MVALQPYRAQLVNLLTNPSFEVDAAGWTGSNTTITRAAAAGTENAEGGSLAVITTTGALSANSPVILSDPIACSPGESLSAMGRVRRTGAWPTAGHAVALRFYDGSNNVLSTAVGTTFNIAAGAPATIKHGNVVGVAPAGTTSVRVMLYTTVAVGSGLVIRADAFMAAKTTALLAAADYFDGSTTDCRWTGTAHASTSIKPSLPWQRWNGTHLESLTPEVHYADVATV